MSQARTVSQLTMAPLVLRHNLKVSLQHSGGQDFYLLEDPIAGKFFRLGVREWTFVRRLREKTLLRNAIAIYDGEDHQDPLSHEDITGVCYWLANSGLIELDDATMSLPERKETPWWLNPMFIRIPLFNPDRFLDHAYRWLGFTLTKLAVTIWLVVCLTGLWQVFDNFDILKRSMAGVFAPGNWIYLLLVWIGLKVVHETCHGIVCKKYGGNVPRCGVVLILFSPIVFVDVTSSWRFRSKWQRIYTAAAGMYAEFFMAGVAAWIWACTDAGALNQVCANIIIAATVSTLLFNANFLMKFDGYYILSDALELQNLYGNGQQYLRFLVRKYWLGVSAVLPNFPPGKKRIIQAYAFASLIWRWVFYIGILATATAMFQGAGLVLAVAAGMLWFLIPATKFARYLWLGAGNEQPKRLRFVGISAGMVAVVISIGWLPWPIGISAPAVVEYAPLDLVRADSSGFVTQVFVQAGQQVKKGDRLLVLENPQLEVELANVRVQIKESQLHSKVFLDEKEMAEYQVVRRKLEELENERDKLIQRVVALEVKAGVSGRVIGQDLDSLVGQFFAEGDFLLAIGNEGSKELNVSIAQDDLQFFTTQEDQPVYARVRGGKRLKNARLLEVDPKGSTALPHRALAAPLNGPLTVTISEDEQGQQDYAFLSPRFVGKISLNEQTARRLLAGQLANVRVRAKGESIGEHLYSTVDAWLRRKMQAAQL